VTVDIDKTTGPQDTPPAGPEAIKAIPVRHYGRYVSAVVAIALLVSIIYAFSQGKINWGAIPDYFFNDRILGGVGRTLHADRAPMLIGVFGGILLAVMRLSKNPVTSSIAWFYIWFFRGTPVLVQLIVWFNLGLVFEYINLGPIYKDYWSSFMTPLLTALLGLGLNEAAYMAEICRAGLLSVDEGQTEASHALGMSHSKTLRRIVIPQAMRVIVPPTGNEVINMLKTTSLVSVVQFAELLRVRPGHRPDVRRPGGDATSSPRPGTCPDLDLQRRPVLPRAVLRPRFQPFAAAHPVPEDQGEHAVPVEPTARGPTA
jgi:polar amino acid transport system permease protein